MALASPGECLQRRHRSFRQDRDRGLDSPSQRRQRVRLRGARQQCSNAGATGIIFVAPPAGLLNLGASPLIASVQVSNADGTTIKAGLPADATISMGVGTDNSVRWLVGEDDTAAGLVGALRDMWNPHCFGNPGKVSDTSEYACSTADQGGVHTNSGVDNHAYALMVDGGTYNGQTITGIGLTKAAHIYFRAKIVYQHPAPILPITPTRWSSRAPT